MDVVPFLRNAFARRFFRGIKRRQERKAELEAATEKMEPRIVLFATTGNAWPVPQVITLSFQPDGTNLGGVTSNLNAKFNASTALVGKWQTEILRAAQSWSAQTNINFVLASDSGASSGSGSYQQGDPTFGDIRIGGYAFGNSTLARAYSPPPVNNYSIAGDIAFNTSMAFGIGSGYDLFTVATHEIGHALGLDHSTKTTSAQMYPSYNGKKSSLSSDDIAGIRNIYSSNLARSADRYDAAAPNSSFAAATNLTSSINTTTLTSQQTGLDLTTTSDVDFYKFTVPAGSSTTAKISVQSSGLSLLAPNVYVYKPDMKTVLASASGLAKYGTTLNVTGSVTAGLTYYVKVVGANTTVFGTGQYALTLNLGTGPTPVVPLPNTTVPNGTPLSAGGGVADSTAANDDFLPGVPSINSVSPDTGASTADRSTTSNSITLNGTVTAGYTVQIFQDVVGSTGTMRTSLGSVVADEDNKWTFAVPGTLSDGQYTYSADGFDLEGAATGTSAQFSVTVDTRAPLQPLIKAISPDSGVVGDGLTNSKTPTVSGTAEPNSRIQVTVDGQSDKQVTADGLGNWTYVVPGTGLSDGSHVVTAIATDVAGNTGSASNPFTVAIDTKAPNTPVVTGITPDSGVVGDAITNKTNLNFVGTADPNSSVQVLLNGTSKGVIKADSLGNWTFNNTATSLSAGSYVLTAIATDAAGNVSSTSKSLTVTINQTLPAAPVITTISPDNGPSASDRVTNSTAIIVSGTTVGSGSVQVYRDNVLVGTAVTNGTWSLDLTGNLMTVGAHSFKGIFTNYIGNVSYASTAVTVTVDTQAPAQPVISTFTTDSGVLGDRITNVKTPTLSGTAEANSRIQVLIDGQATGSPVVVSSTGTWSALLSSVSDGSRQFTVTATDLAGNASVASSPFALTIDTKAPSAPVVASINPDSGVVGDAITNQKNLIFSGTAEANSSVKVLLGTTTLGTIKADSLGNWTWNNTASTLSVGSYTVTATATDAAGNVSSSGTLTVKIDQTLPAAPLVTSISPDNGISSTDAVTTTGAFKVSGTTVGNGSVQVYRDGLLVGTAASDGKWTLDLTGNPTGVGPHAFTAKFTNYVGNVSTLSSALTVTIDTFAPSQPVITGYSLDSGVIGDGITNVKMPTLAGMAEPNSRIQLFIDGQASGSLVLVTGTGTWSCVASSLSDGAHQFTVTASDVAGNISPSSNTWNITVDTKSNIPTVLGISPDTGASSIDEITRSRNLVLNGQADAGDTVKVFRAGTLIGSVTADTSGMWTLNYSNVTLADGAYAFTAQSSDAAGNLSSVSSALSVTVDNAISTPVVSTVTRTLNTNGTQSFLVQGTAALQSSIEVRLGSSVVGTTNTDSQGNWKYTYTASASDGIYGFSSVATDLAGNSATSNTYNVTVDTRCSPPGILGISPDTGASSTDKITNARNLVLNGVADAGDTVKISLAGQIIGTVAASTAGTWTFNYANVTLAAGTHAFTAQASDAAGNVSQVSSTLSVTIDTTITTPVVGAVMQVTNGNGTQSLVIQGTADANSSVQVSVGGVALGATNADGQGDWSYTYTPDTITEVTYSFTAVATDLAGNQSGASAAYVLVIGEGASLVSIPSLSETSVLSTDINGIATTVNTPTLTGSGTAGSTIKIYDGSRLLGTTVVGSDGNWSFVTSALSTGDHAVASDSLGQNSLASSVLNFRV